MSRKRMSEAWADIGPAVAQRSAEEEAVLSAEAEKRAALKARPDKRNEAVPVEVNLVEWMKTGFFECGECRWHWQPEQVAPAGEQAQRPSCPKCGSPWRVRWVPPAF